MTEPPMERDPAETITGLMKLFDASLRRSEHCFFQSSTLLKSGSDRIFPEKLWQTGPKAEIYR